MANWVDICAKSDVGFEDLITREIAGKRYAIYQSPDGMYFCTDGVCSHEQVDLGDGFVQDYEIECPKHNARFDYRTGEVLSSPACINLNRYELRENGERIEILI